MNKVILIGNLGRDPELRYTPSGAAVANFSIATTERYTDKAGEKQQKTEWHNLVAWARTAEIVAEYLSKGSKVAIEGKLQTRDWEDKDGGKRSTTEIVVDRLEMLGDGNKKAQPPARPNSAPQASNGRSGDDRGVRQHYTTVAPQDDDIPF